MPHRNAANEVLMDEVYRQNDRKRKDGRWCDSLEPAGDRASPTTPLVSVIIVNFNGGPLLTRTVESVLTSDVDVEVLVVDNASTDGSVDRLLRLGDHSRLRIIRNATNVGFTRANNIALKQAVGSAVLLLNPDCIIEPDTIRRLSTILQQHSDAGMVGCLIRNEDGTEQAGCRRSVPTPWRTLVRVLHLDKLIPNHRRFQNFVLTRQPVPTKPVTVEAISGAFMLARREAIQQVGLMDEGYFLHCDDLDWCMRFQKAGWKILFVPDVEVTHHQGTCSAGRPIFVLWHKHKGMVRFYRKFFRHQYPLPLMVLVVGAVCTRFCLLAANEVLKLATRRFRDFAGTRVKQVILPLSLERSPVKERRRPMPESTYLGPERRVSACDTPRPVRMP